ncbi:MAG TPA: outer membrane lipoprotein carrier protein LolA [Thermoanaerobaculia bacterium]|nr:outer membrane lipoprotein carrier protein LolA [Thermoanaerobaculia bacterium]
MKKHLTATLSALLLAASALIATPAVAAAPPDPMSPSVPKTARLQALLERVKYEQKALKTMEARFVQQQESSMLAEPEESSGVFSYSAPDSVRWEYQAPSPITVVIRGDDMTTWYRDLNRADKLKVGRYSSQFFKYLGASGNMQTLLDYFTVKLQVPAKKGDPYRLEMTPRYARIAKRLKSMTLWIDSEMFFPTRLEYVEADGDSTRYRFENVRRNVSIPAERFVLQLPRGVQTRVIDLGEKGRDPANPIKTPAKP